MIKRRILAFMLCIGMLLGETSYAVAAEVSTGGETVIETVSPMENDVPTESEAKGQESGEDTQKDQETDEPEAGAGESENGESQSGESQSDESESGEPESGKTEENLTEEDDDDESGTEQAGTDMSETEEETEETTEETTEEATEVSTETEEETEEETTEESEEGVLSASSVGGVELLIDDTSDEVAYESLQDAVDKIVNEYLTEEGGAEKSYNLILQGNATVSGSTLDFSDTEVKFHLNLNGHTLTVSDDATITVGVAGGWDDEGNALCGKVVVAKDKTLSVVTSDLNGTVDWDNVDISFHTDSRTGGIIVGKKYLDDGSSKNLNRVHLNNVGMSELVRAEFYGGVHCDAELDVEVLRAETLRSQDGGEEQYIYFAQPVTAGCVELLEGGCGNADTFKVAGQTSVSSGTYMNVRGEATFGNLAVMEGLDDSGFGICLEELVDTDNDNALISYGKVNFNGNLTKAESLNGAINFNKVRTAIDGDGNETPMGDIAFQVGESLANVALAADDIPTSYFGLNDVDGVGLIVERDGNVLKAVTMAVRVEGHDDSGWWMSQTYSSVDKAIAGLTTDFGGRTAEYDFVFLTDSQLTKNVTIPSFVQHLTLCSEGNGHAEPEGSDNWIVDSIRYVILDFHGYSMTIPSTVTLREGLALVDMTGSVDASGNAKSKLVITASTGDEEREALYVETVDRDIPFKSALGWGVERNEDLEFVAGIQIQAANGVVALNKNQYDYSVSFRPSPLQAKKLSVYEGQWNMDAASVGELHISGEWFDTENETQHYAASVSFTNLTVTGGTAENYGYCYVDNALTMATGTFRNEGELEAGMLNMSGATFRNCGTVHTGVLDMASGTFYNGEDRYWAVAYIADVKAIKDFYNVTADDGGGNPDGSLFICDTFSQNSKGKAYLDAGTVFIVNESATIYNPVIGGQYGAWDGATVLYRMPESTVAVEGTVSRKQDWFNMAVGIVDTDGFEGAKGISHTTAAGVVFIGESGNVLYEVGDEIPVQDLAAKTVLFTTKNTAFPIDYFVTIQKSEESVYNRVLQSGQNICVAGEWIRIWTRGIADAEGNAEEILLKGFVNWKDAAAYLETLSNASLTYIVEITEDLNIEAPLTLPKNAARVEFRGASDKEGGRVELTYTGDISLSSDTAFINMDLKAEKNGAEYNSIVKLNGKRLELCNTNAVFASVTGTATSTMLISGERNYAGIEGNLYQPTVEIKGAITTLDMLELFEANLAVGANLKASAAAVAKVKTLVADNANIEVGNGNVTITGDAILVENVVLQADAGAISVSGMTVLKSATISTKGKVTLKDVTSLNDKNNIVCGGNTKSNMLTISGVVYGPGPEGEDAAYYGDTKVAAPAGEYVFDEENGTNTVRKAAINIALRQMEDAGYSQDAVLLSAPKVQSEWFIVGSTYDEGNGDRTGFGSLTHKNGTNILYGALINEAIVLQVRDGEDSYMVYGSYATLQEAFDEVERIGNATAEYRILIKDDSPEVFNISKAFVTPTKASKLVIATPDGEVAKTFHYSKSITLKTNLVFENVILASKEASSTIALGDYWLDFTNGTAVADGKKITSVAGSGVVKNSGLGIYGYTDGATVTINGSLANVGGLYLDKATLRVEGMINVGNVETVNASKLFGAAKVTTVKNSTDIAQIVSQITINGVVNDWDDTYLTVGLLQQTTSGYQPIDFYGNDDDALLNKGIQLVKALQVSTENIKVASENVGDASNGEVTKSGGYLVYRDGVDLGVTLSYLETVEDGTVEITTQCRTFAEAVAEINSLKTKRDYVIRLHAETEQISLDEPTVLTMPNKSFVDMLTIVGWDSDDEEPAPVKLHYLKNIVLSSNVVLNNVEFVQVEKVDGEYVPIHEVKDDYPSAVSFNTAGNNLYVAGAVTFNTPVLFNGGGKGSLYIYENGQIYTVTNEEVYEDDIAQNVVRGSISGFAEVNVEAGQNLYVKEFGVLNKSSMKITAAKLDGVSLYNRGQIYVSAVDEETWDSVSGSVKFTNTYVDGGQLFVYGKADFTNVTMAGESPQIEATKDFTIKKTLTNTSDSAKLISARKAENKEPYLNISGNVVLENAETNLITVGVKYSEAEIKEGVHTSDYPLLGDAVLAPSTDAQLLTVKTAGVELFVPAAENVGVEAYSDTKTDGYILGKVKNNIYVHYGNHVRAALCEGDVSNGKLNEAIAQNKLLGYYPSYKDAVAALDARKDKQAEYTILLLQDVESASAPGALAVPKTAARVYVVGEMKAAGDAAKNVYFTGNVKLGTNTEFVNVAFQPMKKSGKTFVGTAADITAGAFDLNLSGVSVGTTDGMSLKNITGNGKQLVIFDSENLVLDGNVTKIGKLVVGSSATVKGNVQATEVVIADGTAAAKTLTVNGSVSADILNMNGMSKLSALYNTVTVKNIVNNGTGENRIDYGKSAKGVSNLTITGEVSGENGSPLCLNLVQDGAGVSASVLGMNAKNAAQVELSADKKLAQIEKAALSGVTMQLNGADVEQGNYLVVKADKAVYVVDNTLACGANVVEVTNSEGTTKCLDLTQAVNEINLANKKEEEPAEGTIISIAGDIQDTNVTDKTDVSALVLPKANVTSKLVVSGDGTKTIRFCGNISYAGDLTMKRLVLDSRNAKSGDAADFSVSVTKDGQKASLKLTDVTTAADLVWANGNAEANGFVSQISGTKGATEVGLENCSLRVKQVKNSSIVKVEKITLTNASLITCGSAEVGELVLEEVSTWDALGKTSVINIDASAMSDGAYVGSKQLLNTSKQTVETLFTVNGKVETATATNGEEVPLPVKAIGVDATETNIVEVARYTKGTALDGAVQDAVGLVVAPKESADKFIAYGLRIQADGTMVSNTEGMTVDNLAAYKDSSYVVKNGDVAEMNVLVARKTSEESAEKDETYANSLDEAVSIIDSLGDKEAYYEIRLLEAGTESAPTIIKTAKGGTEYGAFVLPSNAKQITIIGLTQEGDNLNVIQYTGKLTPKCDVVFKDVCLTEGTVSKTEGFVPTYAITPTFGKTDYLMKFDNTRTLKNGNETNANAATAAVVLDSASGNAGALEFAEGINVYVKDALETGSLVLSGNEVTVEKDIAVADVVSVTGDNEVKLVSLQGKLSLNEVDVQGGDVLVKGTQAITIGAINGNATDGDEEKVTVDTCFAKVKKAGQDSVSQLTINGSVENVRLVIAPRMYDFASDSYYMLDEEAARQFVITDMEETPVATQKLATMPKADGKQGVLAYSTDDLSWDGELDSLDEVTVSGYKYEGGFYVTTLEPAVIVTGFVESAGSENRIYEASFLSWEQAVKEIDRIGDKNIRYEIDVTRNLGDVSEGCEPLAKLTMPAKAKHVTVKSENKPGSFIFFATNKLVLQCDTTFENVGLLSVKKMGKEPETWYETVFYDINAGSYDLTQNTIWRFVDNNGWYENMVGTISAKAQASYTFYQGDSSEHDVNDLIETPAQKISGFGEVTFENCMRSDAIDNNGDWESRCVVNLNVPKGIKADTMILNPYVHVYCGEGDVSLKELEVKAAEVCAKNITVSGRAVFNRGTLSAGTKVIGDGKVKLADVILAGENNYIGVKQDKKGNSQFEVTGTVEKAADYDGYADICVGVHYNNSMENFAQLHQGMLLVKAPKADASWFSPAYAWEEEGETQNYHPEMGAYVEGYGVFKSGKEIRYGVLEEVMKVKLMDWDEENNRPYADSHFATYEEAVKEIDARGKADRMYVIELLNLVEVGNEKGGGKYKALTMPSKTRQLIIRGNGNDLLFSGNVTLKCNLAFEDVRLQPVKLVKGNVEPVKANYNVGKFNLSLAGVASDTWNESGEWKSLFGNISGAKQGSLCICGNEETELENAYFVEVDNVTGIGEVSLNESAVLKVNGNCNVGALVFRSSAQERIALLDMCGTLTTGVLAQEGSGKVYIEKLPEKDIKVTGEMSGEINVRLKADSCQSGTMIIGGKGASLNGVRLYDRAAESKEYTLYQSGDAVYCGSMID